MQSPGNKASWRHSSDGAPGQRSRKPHRARSQRRECYKNFCLANPLLVVIAPSYAREQVGTFYLHTHARRWSISPLAKPSDILTRWAPSAAADVFTRQQGRMVPTSSSASAARLAPAPLSGTYFDDGSTGARVRDSTDARVRDSRDARFRDSTGARVRDSPVRVTRHSGNQRRGVSQLLIPR